MHKPFVQILFFLLVIVLTSACSGPVLVRAGELVTESRSVDLGPADSARVQIVIDMGDLTIQGGAGRLLDGTFYYNVTNWRPQLSYEIDDNQGVLLISQPDKNVGLFGSEGESRWNLDLGDGVPIDLEIKTGLGNSVLDLSEVDLTRLDIETGAGNVDIDLSGARTHDLPVSIKGGLGNLNLVVPEQTGVRVTVKSGLGNIDLTGFDKDGNVYVNDAYGSTPETIDLVVEAGLGDISLRNR